ncbi:hypothetical protein PROPEN_00255 [Proteus penneri ATCC 35198]|nr:hypothetical protein PROPEN_00255 [Proteus penneri ATCC 35198]
MNTIETTDFAELYKNHMVQAERTKKEPEHWDKRAEKKWQKPVPILTIPI